MAIQDGAALSIKLFKTVPFTAAGLSSYHRQCLSLHAADSPGGASAQPSPRNRPGLTQRQRQPQPVSSTQPLSQHHSKHQWIGQGRRLLVGCGVWTGPGRQRVARAPGASPSAAAGPLHRSARTPLRQPPHSVLPLAAVRSRGRLSAKTAARDAFRPLPSRRPSTGVLGGIATPSPCAFIFSVQNAVCKDSYRLQCRRNRLLRSLPT